MKINPNKIVLNDILERNSEIIISYSTADGPVIINRVYIRYHYSKCIANHLFVIAKEKAEKLIDGTVCSINSQTLTEFNFKAKLFRTSKDNFEKVCTELTNLYHYDSPETLFEIFEATDIEGRENE